MKKKSKTIKDVSIEITFTGDQVERLQKEARRVLKRELTFKELIQWVKDDVETIYYDSFPDGLADAMESYEDSTDEKRYRKEYKREQRKKGKTNAK